MRIIPQKLFQIVPLQNLHEMIKHNVRGIQNIAQRSRLVAVN